MQEERVNIFEGHLSVRFPDASDATLRFDREKRRIFVNLYNAAGIWVAGTDFDPHEPRENTDIELIVDVPGSCTKYVIFVGDL